MNRKISKHLEELRIKMIILVNSINKNAQHPLANIIKYFLT